MRKQKWLKRVSERILPNKPEGILRYKSEGKFCTKSEHNLQNKQEGDLCNKSEGKFCTKSEHNLQKNKNVSYDIRGMLHSKINEKGAANNSSFC